jgi:hypothetical protein
MDVTAMPEVVGDAGITVSTQDPEEVAHGISEALSLDAGAHARARERILTEFPMEIRREGIHAAVHAAIDGRGR